MKKKSFEHFLELKTKSQKVNLNAVLRKALTLRALASKFPSRVSYKVVARGYLRLFLLLKIEKDPQIQSDR